MDLPILTTEDPESLCRRCGASCHMAMQVGGVNYLLEEIHCKFLGRDDHGRYLCTVYEKRFEVAPWCHTAVDAASKGHVAQDCLYAAHIPGYQGKHWATGELREELLKAARQVLIEKGLPLSNSPDAALRILTAGGEAWSYAETEGCYVFHRC